MLSFCNSSPAPSRPSGQSTGSGQDFQFPYDLGSADAEYKLPGALEEISGLAWCGKDKLACVQDEKGHIYVLDLEKDIDITKYNFGKDGDYEDIAVHKQTIYVLRNDGRIYRVKDLKEDKIRVKKYETPLSEKNDTEGMAFDPLTHSLLIACKGSPSIEKENPYKGFRAVYRFDLETKELVEKPHFLVDLDNLDSYSDRGTFERFSMKVARKLKLVDSETPFKPSGISIHPEYGDVYIISNIGKLLIVMDRRGKVLYIHELDAGIFRQPEGICFSPEGDLYISSEGQGGKGYILKFNSRLNE
jgi:uncharacterized protein YjiK